MNEWRGHAEHWEQSLKQHMLIPLLWSFFHHLAVRLGGSLDLGLPKWAHNPSRQEQNISIPINIHFNHTWISIFVNVLSFIRLISTVLHEYHLCISIQMMEYGLKRTGRHSWWEAHCQAVGSLWTTDRLGWASREVSQIGHWVLGSQGQTWAACTLQLSTTLCCFPQSTSHISLHISSPGWGFPRKSLETLLLWNLVLVYSQGQVYWKNWGLGAPWGQQLGPFNLASSVTRTLPRTAWVLRSFKNAFVDKFQCLGQALSKCQSLEDLQGAIRSIYFTDQVETKWGSERPRTHPRLWSIQPALCPPCQPLSSASGMYVRLWSRLLPPP